MFTNVERCPRKVGVDLFLNIAGSVTMEHYAFKTDDDAIDATEFSIGALVAEFIAHSINPETERIECAEAKAVYLMIDELKRSVAMLEAAVFDDDFTALGSFTNG